MNILKPIKGPFHIWAIIKHNFLLKHFFSVAKNFFLPISCFSYDNNVLTVEFISEIRVVTFSIFHDWTLFVRNHSYFRFKKYILFPRLRELCVCATSPSLFISFPFLIEKLVENEKVPIKSHEHLLSKMGSSAPSDRENCLCQMLLI